MVLVLEASRREEWKACWQQRDHIHKRRRGRLEVRWRWFYWQYRNSWWLGRQRYTQGSYSYSSSDQQPSSKEKRRHVRHSSNQNICPCRSNCFCSSERDSPSSEWSFEDTWVITKDSWNTTVRKLKRRIRRILTSYEERSKEVTKEHNCYVHWIRPSWNSSSPRCH